MMMMTTVMIHAELILAILHVASKHWAGHQDWQQISLLAELFIWPCEGFLKMAFCLHTMSARRTKNVQFWNKCKYQVAVSLSALSHLERWGALWWVPVWSLRKPSVFSPKLRIVSQYFIHFSWHHAIFSLMLFLNNVNFPSAGRDTATL